MCTRAQYSVLTLTFCLILFSPFQLVAQQDWWELSVHHEAQFLSNSKQNCGFDRIKHPEWNEQFEPVQINDTTLIPSIQSVYKGQIDNVCLLIDSILTPSTLSFYLDGIKVEPTIELEGDTIHFEIPPLNKEHLLECRDGERTIALLRIIVFKPLIEHLTVVNLGAPLSFDELQRTMDTVFKQAGLKVFISSVINYKDSVFNSDHTFANPDPNHEIFTPEMRELRDRFFQAFPSASKETYYLFVVNSFNNRSLNAYGAKNKALSFATIEAVRDHPLEVVRELARNIGMLEDSWMDGGPIKGSSFNLMDEPSGFELTLTQWLKLRHSSRSFSFYDADEDLPTNNGLVAYYFWEEDENGNIILNNGQLLSAIKRPFRKNYLSYHLNIQDPLFQIAIDSNGIRIHIWHLVIWGGILVIAVILRIRMIRKWKQIVPGRVKRNVRSILFFTTLTGIMIGSYYFVHFELKQFVVDSGEVESLSDMSIQTVIDATRHNTELKGRDEEAIKSEVLVQRNGKWIMSRRSPVLYFNATVDSAGNINSVRFDHDGDSIHLEQTDYHQKAYGHHMVITYRHSSKIKEVLYNYEGRELNTSISEIDPAKRILLFINGYRPTSLGHNFEDNFEDVLKKGFEYPHSSNMIYTFDRYDYWQPWQAIDDRFKERINPQQTFYADGHFSVSTSNYRSLFNFSKVAASYPKRCKNPEKHHCNGLMINTNRIFGKNSSSTTNLLPQKSNTYGFNTRRSNGKTAGINLLSVLNELPGLSRNDTLFIVAHSMGYAYALGVVDAIGSEINLGGFYIIAPENAKSGKVKKGDWKEVWQYGSDLSSKVPACLQDGIAPQTKVSGLTRNERCYFPAENWYTKQGFFNSHFIGYYTWIFDIPPGKKGHITQR